MADVKAKQRVQLNDGTNERGVALAYPVYVGISDGTELANVNASNQLEVEIKNAAVTIDDGGSSITVDGTVAATQSGTWNITTLTGITNDVNIADGGNSITVDGTVAISGSVTVTASDLDIRDLTNASDSVLIYANTAKDGSGTNYVPLVDTDGHLQVDVLSLVNGEKLDDAAFTVGTDKVSPIGAMADEAAPDSVDEGDAGIVRMTLDRKLLTRVVGATDSNRLDIDASGHAQIDLAAVSVTAVPVSKDTSANAETNPLFVQVVSGVLSGLEVHDYDTQAALAKDGTDNHDYAVTGGKTLRLSKVTVSASGATKAEVQVGPVASLVTKAVKFGSPSSPNIVFEFNPPIEIPDTGTGTVRVIRRNDDHQAMDVYSTIMGSEI